MSAKELSRIQNHQRALQFIRDVNAFHLELDIDQLLQYLFNDLSYNTYNEHKIYLESIFSTLRPQDVALFLDSLSKIIEPMDYMSTIGLFLIQSQRPVFKLHGVEIALNLQDKRFIPYIIPIIYTKHIPLRQKAIETILSLQGKAEEILEQHLQEKVPSKQHLASKILKKLNPQNAKLGIFMLQNEDFIIRIEGIKILAETNNNKYLSKIEPYLDDTDMAVRKAAIEAISQFGGRKAKQILNQKLIEEEFPPLREIIQTSLEKI